MDGVGEVGRGLVMQGLGGYIDVFGFLSSGLQGTTARGRPREGCLF